MFVWSLLLFCDISRRNAVPGSHVVFIVITANATNIRRLLIRIRVRISRRILIIHTIAIIRGDCVSDMLRLLMSCTSHIRVCSRVLRVRLIIMVTHRVTLNISHCRVSRLVRMIVLLVLSGYYYYHYYWHRYYHVVVRIIPVLRNIIVIRPCLIIMVMSIIRIHIIIMRIVLLTIIRTCHAKAELLAASLQVAWTAADQPESACHNPVGHRWRQRLRLPTPTHGWRQVEALVLSAAAARLSITTSQDFPAQSCKTRSAHT